MKGYARHKIVYRTIRIILIPYLRFRFGYRYRKAPAFAHPTLVLSNHNTDWDPMFLSQSFSQHLYFVASEHMFRWGLLSKFIVFLAMPIARAKATNDSRTVKQILRNLNAGASVCVFAEGNRSFNGVTSDIPISIAKLVRQSKAALVTYRLTGGYLTQPRWGRTIRRGQVEGGPVNTYEPEDLARMTDEEVHDLIKRDLYVNAYADQSRLPISFSGNRLAEHLQTVLYLCPKCGRHSSLSTIGDTLYCDCGLSLRYTPFGFFETTTGEAPPFSTILEWDQWQTSVLKEQIVDVDSQGEERPITSDLHQALSLIHKREAAISQGEGKLSLYRNRLEFQPMVNAVNSGEPMIFLLNSISAIAVHGQMDIVFSMIDGRYFELGSSTPRSATKYMELIRILSIKE
jgi:1-acyl-sn-glycerol-3-phosphate acyltransferase